MSDATVRKEEYPDPFQKLEDVFVRVKEMKRVMDRLYVVYPEETRLDKIQALQFMLSDTCSELERYLYPEKE